MPVRHKGIKRVRSGEKKFWIILSIGIASCIIVSVVLDVKSFFHKIMNLVDGVHAIIVADHDGVPVLQVKDDKVQDSVLKSHVLAMSGTTIEQGSKIGLGQTKNVAVVFAKFQLVCFNKLPLIVTIYADKNANTGHILSLEQELSTIIAAMQQVVNIPEVVNNSSIYRD